jgi:hypothetical protein
VFVLVRGKFQFVFRKNFGLIEASNRPNSVIYRDLELSQELSRWIFKILLLTLAQHFDIFSPMKTYLFKGLAVISLVVIIASPLYAQTADTANQPAQEQSVGSEAGYGIGSALANVFYIPAKITYAGLGVLTGGLGYLLSGGRTDVANNIIYPAVGGNYVVTPSHLKGTEPIYFVGAPPLEPEQSASTTPSTVTR